MAKVWKILALLLVTTALVWLTTLWRWQSNLVDPSSTDLLLNLAVLPVALTAVLVLTLWAVKRLRSYAVAPPPTALAAAPAQASAAPSSAASERSAHVKVLASSVFVRAGSKWADAQSGIASGECKPGLDAQLKDDDGIAVFTAPMPDLSTDVVADELAEIIATLAPAKPEAWAGYETPTEMLRALALIGMAVDTMLPALEAQWPALRAPPPTAVRGQQAAPVLPPAVSIRVGISSRWPALSQQLANAWLEQQFDRFIEAGLAAAGQSRAMAHTSRPAVQLHVHPVDSAEALWLLIDQQVLQWQRDQQSGLLWVLAADSLVSDADTAAMAAARELFSGNNQRGRVPGEAAAALLLATPSWPAPADAEPPQAMLYRANLLRRDKSADAAGRVSPATLLQSATGALQASGWAAAQVEHLTTDADHRASRTAEVYETVQELLPHIDTGEQALRLGVGCGDVGIARLLACVALSAGQVNESDKPGLVLGAFPALERFAVVVTPPVAPPVAVAAAAPVQAA